MSELDDAAYDELDLRGLDNFTLIHRHPVAEGVAVLCVGGEAKALFEHYCTRANDYPEPVQRGMLIAPYLSKHTITHNDDGQVTVRASILCRGCGVHGFVTDDQWANAGGPPFPDRGDTGG